MALYFLPWFTLPNTVTTKKSKMEAYLQYQHASKIHINFSCPMRYVKSVTIFNTRPIFEIWYKMTGANSHSYQLSWISRQRPIFRAGNEMSSTNVCQCRYAGPIMAERALLWQIVLGLKSSHHKWTHNFYQLGRCESKILKKSRNTLIYHRI